MSPKITFGEPWPEFNGGLSYRDLVWSPDSGLTLIEFYTNKHKSSAPLQGWLQRIENGQITIDGTVVADSNTVLRTVEELVYHRRPWREPEALYLLEVLFEDEHLTVLNKPSCLQVLPGGLFQQRIVLTWRTKRMVSSLVKEELHPAPVHRLGRGTSGILLCAKTKLAETKLAAFFADKTSAVGGNRKHGARRIFCSLELIAIRPSPIFLSNPEPLSITVNSLDSLVIDIEQPIGTLRYPGVASGLFAASPSGKPALSKVYALERDIQRDQTIGQVEIQSGRPHQIRINLSFIGHPLIGDPLYVAGGIPKGYLKPTNPVPGDCRYLLHAHELTLSHPMTNEVIKIVAPLPSVLLAQGEEERKQSQMPNLSSLKAKKILTSVFTHPPFRR